jgi:hypothetical protein
MLNRIVAGEDVEVIDPCCLECKAWMAKYNVAAFYCPVEELRTPEQIEQCFEEARGGKGNAIQGSE